MSAEHDPYGGHTRRQYLEELAQNYGAPLSVVLLLADALGESEDFDGLVTEVEDYVETEGDR